MRKVLLKYDKLYYARVQLRPLQTFITHELNTIWRQNLYQSTSLAEAQKALEAHGCKLSVNQLIDHSPYTRYTNRKYYLLYKFFVLLINESQVNAHVV